MLHLSAWVRSLALGALVFGGGWLAASGPAQAADARAAETTSAEKAAMEKADAIADRVMEALGGEDAWEDTRFIRFTFAGFRTHHWDKATGRHRLEFTDREDKHHLVLHTIDSRQGRAWMDGEELEGEALAKALEDAHAAWVNDTYWLVMPYKLRDPGVTLSYDKETKVGDVVYDRLHMSFDGVGLTPGDQYWVYVNPDTGLVDRWEYSLESYEAGQAPTMWVWSDWKDYNGIMLASGRSNPESGRELPLGDIAVYESLPDAVFTSPEPVADR